MKLGLTLGYSGAKMSLPVETVLKAEELGFDSVWTGEAYGSDAMTPLAYLAALTTRIRLATGIIQLAGRTPANAAMQAGTIDGLSGGRFICGVGVSGPQIVEGWYGEPWGQPLDRLRDYITIMKKIFAREEPVSHQGKEISLPYTGPGAAGLGKPLKSILHMRPDLPVFMGSITPGGLRLAGEVADGIIGMLGPKEWPTVQKYLEQGFAKAGNGKSLKDFEVYSGGAVIVTNDVKAAIDRLKPGRALYIGGMGARQKNFHNERMIQRGYPNEAKMIQDLFLAGRKEEAAAVIPDEFIDEEALIGPPDRIREKFKAWEDSGIQGMNVGQQPEAMELMAEITGSKKKITPVSAR